MLALEAVEIPPRHAVLRGHDDRLRPEQGCHGLGLLPGLIGLETDDHDILLPEIMRVLRATDVSLQGLLAHDEL